MNRKIEYQFKANMWKHKAEGGWYFISIPQEYSEEIRTNLQWQEEGWGRMKADAIINDFSWNTSIWFDSKLKLYILPVKAEVRKKLALTEEKELSVTVLV